MLEYEQLFFRDRESFHNWLSENHSISKGILMLFFKKHTQETCITYREALEEALCFGWIDSTLKSLDNDRYLRMFTPRSNTSNWSNLNKSIVAELIKNGRMTEAGLMKIDVYNKKGKVDWSDDPPMPKKHYDSKLSELALNEFAKNQPALDNFNKLSETNKKYFIRWIESAKREETRNKRIMESIDLLKENKKLGLK